MPTLTGPQQGLITRLRRRKHLSRRAYQRLRSAGRAYQAVARGELRWKDVRLALGAVKRQAIQKPAELAQLISLLREGTLQTVAEIGTAHGGTFWLWCRLAAPDALVISMDLPGEFAGGGGNAEEMLPILRSFSRATQETAFIRANSHSATAARQFEEILGDRLLDFLFVDGDHSYEGVKRDFELYSAYVRPGGLIAFHDVLPQPSSGVDRFWREVEDEFETVEFLDDSDRRRGRSWAGIGVIRWSEERIDIGESGARIARPPD